MTYWHCLWKGQAWELPRVENRISRSSCRSVVGPVSAITLSQVGIHRGVSRYKKPSKCVVRLFQDWVVQVLEITCKDTCGPPVSRYLVWTWYSLMIPCESVPEQLPICDTQVHAWWLTEHLEACLSRPRTLQGTFWKISSIIYGLETKQPGSTTEIPRSCRVLKEHGGKATAEGLLQLGSSHEV